MLGITSLEQLENFSLRPGGGKQRGFATLNLSQHIDEAKRKREALESMPSDTPEQIAAKAALYVEAEESVAKLSAVADVLLAVEGNGKKGRTYESEREASAERMLTCWAEGVPELQRYAEQKILGRRRLHWALVFPEVMGGAGFDALIGNPPFLGGRRISFRLGENYYSQLQSLFPWAIGTTDLCVYFLRRACQILRKGGISGLVLSDIVTQGDSREAGIVHLCSNGFTIISGRSSRPWPGSAGVRIINGHFRKGNWCAKATFDSITVDSINSYFHPGAERLSPHQLYRNQGVSFSGYYLGGQGFLISERVAADLVHRNPLNAEVIFNYIKGDELNNTYHQSLPEKAINFGARDFLEIEERYPEALEIVRQQVKPERDKVRRQSRRERWWRYAEASPGLSSAVGNSELVLLQPYTAKYVMPSFYNARCVFAHPLVVITDPSYSRFAALQSTFHTLWVWSYCATNLDLLAYTADRVFGTFPFPTSSDSVTEIGRRYAVTRDNLRLSRHLALTEIYNRVNDPSEADPELIAFRNMHIELDQTVANAYGWQSLELDHGFHKTKQGIRYTLSEAARREVLDRLLALNHQRHAEEEAEKAALPVSASAKRGRKPKETSGQIMMDL